MRQALLRDDRRLLALVADAVRDPCYDALTLVARAVRRHLRVTEGILFPTIEWLVEDRGLAATASARREHRIFLSLLADVEEHMRVKDTGAARATLAELGAALRVHLEAEEASLHPMADRVLNEATVRDMADLLEQ